MDNKLCWVCLVEPASTGEHKFPYSYLKKIPDDWRGIAHGRWDGQSFKPTTQGPNSRNLKLKVLCANCNNHKTQAQDYAVNALISDIKDGEAEVWSSRMVDLGKFDTLNLYRGLIKMEFSRLYADGVSVIPEVSSFVNGGGDWRAVNKHVRIEFRAAEGAKIYGLVYPFDSNAPYYSNPYFISHQINFGWFGVHFLYAPGDRPELAWPSWSFGSVALLPGDLDPSFIPRL